MQIKRVELENFRQFYGKQKLEFPVNGSKNVTLIHAENGFGKTSILNAVLWCLFEQHTPKFERPKDIINYQAHDQGISSATVTVAFGFRDEEYLVQRTFFDKAAGRENTRLAASRIEGGNYKQLRAPETFVASVVPPEMAKYFFFDGEAAESFASAHNYKAIGQAIRSILGCSLAETAISDLKAIRRAIDKQIGETSEDENLERIEISISKLEVDLEKHEDLLEQHISDRQTIKELRDSLQEQLRGLDAVKGLQGQRDRAVGEKSRIETSIKAVRKRIIEWISTYGMSTVSRRLSQIGLDFIDEESLKGRIPSPYNEEFVKGLLADRECICGRPLEPESDCWRSVSDLLRTASNADALNRVVRIKARMEVLKADYGKAPDQLTAYQKQWKTLLDERGAVETEIEAIRKKILGLNLDDIAEKERAMQAAEKKISKFDQEIGGIKARIGSMNKQKEVLGRQLKELARLNDKASKLLGRKELVEKAVVFLGAILREYEGDAREKIEAKINSILDEVAHKNFTCILDETFTVDLVHNERKTAKSAGENQLLSLAFIAALVEFAASRIEDQNMILRPGTLAPLVLDAPLGQLDPSYQQSVAEFLPKLAHQVVLLVSGSQGGDAVLEKLAPHVSAEYVLIQENSEPRGNRKGMKRAIHGKEYDLIRFGQEVTMTHVERIR